MFERLENISLRSAARAHQLAVYVSLALFACSSEKPEAPEVESTEQAATVGQDEDYVVMARYGAFIGREAVVESGHVGVIYDERTYPKPDEFCMKLDPTGAQCYHDGKNAALTVDRSVAAPNGTKFVASSMYVKQDSVLGEVYSKTAVATEHTVTLGSESTIGDAYFPLLPHEPKLVEPEPTGDSYESGGSDIWMSSLDEDYLCLEPGHYGTISVGGGKSVVLAADCADPDNGEPGEYWFDNILLSDHGPGSFTSGPGVLHANDVTLNAGIFHLGRGTSHFRKFYVGFDATAIIEPGTLHSRDFAIREGAAVMTTSADEVVQLVTLNRFYVNNGARLNDTLADGVTPGNASKFRVYVHGVDGVSPLDTNIYLSSAPWKTPTKPVAVSIGSHTVVRANVLVAGGPSTARGGSIELGYYNVFEGALLADFVSVYNGTVLNVRPGILGNAFGTYAITAGDFDNDSVGDELDNCSELSNLDQADGDGDGVGDVCDNCPAVGNALQEPSVASGTTVGAACSGESLSYCGDGVVDTGNGEFCDEGTAGNGPEASCAMDCQSNALAVLEQPQDVLSLAGATAIFGVRARGTGLSYQWLRDGTEIAGANNRGFAWPNVTLADDGALITVVVTRTTGTTASLPATLTVQAAAPKILDHPTSARVIEGGDTELTVFAVGGDLTYQWQLDGVDVAGATTTTLALSAVTMGQTGGIYRCFIQNPLGSITSAPAALTVLRKALTVVQAPVDVTVYEGEDADFSVNVLGTGATYEWSVDGVQVAGAVGSELTLTAVDVSLDGSTVEVEVLNDASRYTLTATLIVLPVTPTIVTNPVDVSVDEGAAASFTCAATGSGLTYSWWRDGALLGDSGAVLTLSPTTMADHGASFHCAATNLVGTVTSQPALLTVQQLAPLITSSPADSTVTEGQSATFTVAASGSDLSYQWARDGSDIAGATGATLTLTSTLSADDGATFQVTVSNPAGSGVSAVATLSVTALAPVVVAQPSAATATEGQNAAFTVSATGAGLTYQWQENGVDLAGKTEATLNLISVAYTANGFSYRVRVSNAGGNVLSGPALLTVGLAVPTVSVPPQDQSAAEGGAATFTVTATGSALSYEWQVGGSPVEAANAPSFTWSGLAATDHNSVVGVRVFNAVGSVLSSTAVLSVVLGAPSIDQGPVNQSAIEDAPATFTVVASGTGLTYQWQRDGIDISGATAAAYSVAAVEMGDDGAVFRVVVGNGSGTVTSLDAALTVTPLPPTITAQPQAITVQEGQDATFGVVVTGHEPGLQWYRGGVAIAGATGSSYVLIDAQTSDDGVAFSVAASNAGGTASSVSAILTVQQLAPVILTAPADTVGVEQGNATFTVVASGSELSYQWALNGTPVGLDAPALALTGLTATQSGDSVAVTVTNGAGAVTSSAATLTVNLLPPVITQSPSSITVADGASASFACVASGTALTYQWLRDGSPMVAEAGVTGVDATTLNLVAVTSFDDTATFVCQVSNSAGTVQSAPAILAVTANAPVITQQPADRVGQEGGGVIFDVVATGTALSYQWYMAGVELAGESGPSLALNNLSMASTGESILVIVSNSVDSVASVAVTLTVNPTPPAVVSEPTDQTVQDGQAATFTTVATGFEHTYQWYDGGGLIVGATEAMLALPSVGLVDDGRQFYCVVSNASGTATTATALLTVVAMLPTIDSEPQDLIVNEGADGLFTVAATGSTPTYQWYRDGAAMAGETTATLNLTALAIADHGALFKVRVSNGAGSVDSRDALLTVQRLPPTLLTEPADQTVAEGASATFAVTVSGTGLQYQWQRDGVDLLGEVAATLLIATATLAHDGAVYSATATNSAGSVTSATATLSVQALAPVFVQEPVNTSAVEGADATFACSATASGPLSYQWERDGAALAGETGLQLVLSAVQVSDDGAVVRCLVSDSAVTVSSASAVLSVSLAVPVLSLSPAAQSVAEGASATFSCDSTSTALSWAWLVDGAVQAGEVGKTLTLGPLAAAMSGALVSCRASNGAGSVQSAAASLTVTLLPPAVLTQPQAQTVLEESDAVFSVSATGTGREFQWYANGVELAGETGPTLTVANVAFADHGRNYYVVVSNAAGSVQSASAGLTVLLAVPTIVTAPQSGTVGEGQSLTLTCSADGSQLTYSWEKDGIAVSGATSSALTLVNATSATAGSYACVADNTSADGSGAGGRTVSAAALVTVQLTAPSITTDPSSQSVAYGAALQLDCAASGTNVTYGWQLDGVDTGDTGATLTVAAVNVSHAGSYVCIADNGTVPALSAAAVVTVVVDAPQITSSPSSQTVQEGQSATFACAASGEEVTYDWYVDGLLQASGGAGSFELPTVTVGDSGSSIVCVANNPSAVPAQSDAAILTVAVASPQITQAPQSQTIDDGASTSFSCAARGTALTLSWQLDGADLGVGGATLDIVQANASHAGDYTCTATNTGGSAVSAVATLTLNVVNPPAIAVPPSSQSVEVGETVSITCGATGAALTYRWQRNGGDIYGEVGRDLIIAAVTLADSGSAYRCVVSNSLGEVTSAAAELTVLDSAAPRIEYEGAPVRSSSADAIVLTGTVVDGSGTVTGLSASNALTGGALLAGVVDNSTATFTVEVPLAAGDNVITLSATDATGNVATAVVTVQVTYAEQPLVSITFPANGAVLSTPVIDVTGEVRSAQPAKDIVLLLGDERMTLSGSGGVYAFTVPNVSLQLGANTLTAVADSLRGQGSVSVTVTLNEGPTSSTPTAPELTVEFAGQALQQAADLIEIQGTADAAAGIAEVTVNGQSVLAGSASTSVAFSHNLSFAALGQSTVVVDVVATTTDGGQAQQQFTVSQDNAAPVLTLAGVQTAPTITPVLSTPYALSGTITEANLAGVRCNGQQVSVLPAGAGSYTFEVALPLQRQQDTALTVEAWDLAGNRSSRDIVLNLTSVQELEILSPSSGGYASHGASTAVEVLARVVGMGASDGVFVQVDGGSFEVLATSGEVSRGTVNVDTSADGSHTFVIELRDNVGTVLAQGTVSAEYSNPENTPLEIVRFEPANNATGIETNEPVHVYFNRAPAEGQTLVIEVYETKHGKVYEQATEPQDFGEITPPELRELHRDREPVPGTYAPTPGERFIGYYPNRQFAYGADVFVVVKVDGVELGRSQHKMRPTPTMIDGAVVNQFGESVPGVTVELQGPAATSNLKAVTDDEGHYSFGFGQPVSKDIPGGGYKLVVNGDHRSPLFTSRERQVVIEPARLTSLGPVILLLLNQAEQRVAIGGGQSPVTLAQGSLVLDVSQASFVFDNGASQGAVMAQIENPVDLGYVHAPLGIPFFGFALDPGTVQVQGGIGVTITLPKRDDSYEYLADLPEHLLITGLDPARNLMVPVGVGLLDKTAGTLQSVRLLEFQRLDAIGVSFPVPTQNYLSAIADYANGDIELDALIQELSTQ